MIHPSILFIIAFHPFIIGVCFVFYKDKVIILPNEEKGKQPGGFPAFGKNIGSGMELFLSAAV